MLGTFSPLIISIHYGYPLDSIKRMKIDLAITCNQKYILDFEIRLQECKITIILWWQSIKKEFFCDQVIVTNTA